MQRSSPHLVGVLDVRTMTTGQDARRTPPLSLWRRSFTGAALWLLLWLTGLPVAHAAVAQLGSPTSLYQSTAGASHSLGSVTVPAGNQRVLIVTASHTGYVDVASVSFGGTAMTKAVERDDGSVAVDSVWFLALGNSASSTSGNVVAQFAMPTTTTATPPRESFLSATTFSGVDQATPISATNAANNPGGANLGSSLTLASAAGDLALDLFDGFRSTGAVTPSVVAGQTLLTSGGGAITGTSPGQSGYRVSTKPGAAPNVTLGWTSNAEAMIHVAVNLRASASVPVSAPTVAAPTATAVTPNSATLGGNVTADGGATITGRGVVYAPTAANSDPLIGGASVTNLTTAGTTGVFTLNASGLTPNTAYSFKAYATNASGTGYTNVGTFTTQSLPTLTLTKLSIGGVGSFDFTGSNGWSSQSITTTTAGVGVTGMTQTLAAAGTSTTITETVPPGFILTGVTCTGLGNGGSATLSGNTLTLDAAATVPGANIACTFTNTKLPTLRLTKVSNGGVGTFTFTGNNGWSSQSITTTTAGAGVAGLTQTLAAAGASTTITETVPPGFILTGVSCTGLGSGGTATLSGNAVILNSSATAAGSNIACTFTNAKLPTLTLIKVSNGGVGTFDFAGTNGLSLQSITTLTPGVGVSGATQTLAAAATVTFITENVPPAFALTAVSCTGLGSGSVTRSGNLVALDTFATVPGANIVCTFTNTAVNPPTVSTPTVTDVTTNSATLGGNVTADGGGLISARGIVLSPTATNNDPLIGGPGVTNLTTSGTTGVFTLNATGLTPSTAYSFKAYATNGAGTVYTSVGSFTTCGAIVVSNGNDSGAGSLRQAIADACAGSTITFASGVTASNLTTAELVIDKNLTINGGTGVTVTRVAGSPNFRIFRIASGTVAISGLTISNGNTTDFGGGIRNSGALTLTDCVITGNSALTGFGGGIFSQAPMVIDGCTISGNQAGNAGGLFHGFNTLTLRNTTVSNNTTEFQGGGVSIQDATATLANCTISGNRSNSSQAAISHLVSSRPASLLTITNCTVTDNVGAAQGFGGIWTGYFTETPGRTLVTQLSNTLVSNNFPDNFTTTTGTANIRVPTPNPFLTSLGHNLDSDGSSGFVNGSNGDLVGTVATPINALLAPLGSFGGRTQTHALLPGSPAVNAGSNAVCAAAPVGGLDQRGIARPQLSSCDIGAFESRGYTLAIEGGNNQVTGPGLAFAQPLAVRVAPVAAGEPVAGGAVSFTAPGSGASATLASNPASINVSGVASTLATANASTGSYTVSATANGASAGVDFALRNAAATVSVNDVTVVEGDTGSVNAVFTVTRSNRDTAFSVNVATAAGTATSGTDFTAVSETLSFAAGPSEPLSQTVTVPVIGDRIDEANEQYTVSLSGLVQTAGTTTIGTATGIGTITDDDVAGITVTPTAGLTTTEAGGTATFTVVLNTQPTADVSIGLSSNDATEGTVSPTSLSFTTANWNVARTVTVTGVDDVIVDGNIGYTILTAAATSTDPNYAGLDPANVGVSNTDNDEAGVILVESGGATTVTEGGATDTYTLVLTSQPTANVVIAVNPNAQLTTAPTSVTFTAANWNVAQTVTVSAVDDAVAEGSHSGTVSHAVTSGDAGYNGQTVAGVTATITDNDNAGVVVTPSGGNTAVAEGGATDSYTLVLTSQPTANVVVAITPNAQLTTAPTSVTFTSANWNVAQTVTLSAVDDAVAEGSHSGSVAHAVSSADASYNGIDVVGVTATITDNDNAGVTVTQSGGNTAVTEGGATDTYTLVLTSQPTANVAVAITPNAQLTTAPTSVIFTSANWNVAQTVTVSAVDDAVAEGSHSGSVAHTVTSADGNYNGITVGGITATITDNDNAGVSVVQSGGSTAVTEGGATDTYTLVLSSQPTANVVIAIAGGTQLTTAPTTATFTSANWNVAQTVTVSAVDDLIAEGPHTGSVTHTVTSADANYQGRMVDSVSATITDNDAAGVLVTESGGNTAVTEGGATDTISVVLSSQPVANVTVTVTPNAQLTVAPSPLTFTSANWNVAQVVTVSASDDNVVEGAHSGTLSFGVTSSDPAYGSITLASITASITDNDSAVLSFNPASVSQSEATSPMVYTVSLSAPVASGVTVTVNSANGTATAGADYTAISGQTVSFAPGSTTAQTVNVSINNDVLDEDNETYTLTLSNVVATGDVTLGAASTATGTIEDDDALPTLSVANVTQPEGNAANTLNFTVSLSPVSGRLVSFTRATVDGTAVSTAPTPDFAAIAASTVTIPAGQTSVTIPVTINGDAVFEGDESFTLSLTGASNATPASLTATATLTEDDQQPTTTTITADLPDPSVVGQGYPVTVEVRAQTLSPLGSVSITDGTGASCNAPLVAGTAPVSTMSCTLTSTSAGAKTLTATYTPASTAFGESSDTEAHTVNAASTSLVLLGPARARIGTAATYTAELSVTAPGSGTPAGVVTVSSGSNSCTITLPTATPSCTITYTTLGSRAVSAVFAPSNGNYSGSTATPVQTLVFASSDVSVTKTNAVATYRPGDLLVYTVIVRNNGPDAAPQVRVRDVAPAGLTNVAWTCEASGGAICPDSGGTGTLDHVVATLPSGGQLTYTYFGNVTGRPLSIVNTAEAILPADTTIEDPNLANNSATDTDLLDDLFTDGFEAPGINSESGGVRLAGASLRSTADEVARVTVQLSDIRGEALRVYARVIGGELQVALAVRGADGTLRLGSWQPATGEPQLTWTASAAAGGYVLSGATLR